MSRHVRLTIATVSLLIPSIAVLIVPYYNRVEPQIFGMPFFYAYQLLWVPLSAIFVAIAYFCCQPSAKGTN